MRQTDKRADLSARPRCDREHSLNHEFVIVSPRTRRETSFLLTKTGYTAAIISCNATLFLNVGGFQYSGCARRQARTRSTCSGPCQ